MTPTTPQLDPAIVTALQDGLHEFRERHFPGSKPREAHLAQATFLAAHLPQPQPQLPAIPTPLERELHVGLAAVVAAPGAVVPGGADLMPGVRRDPLLVARVDRQVRLALEAAQLREDLDAARAELARVTEGEARMWRLMEVHARYFDMEGTPGRDDTNPSPEDVWRYDRDFRAALLAPTEDQS